MKQKLIPNFVRGKLEPPCKDGNIGDKDFIIQSIDEHISLSRNDSNYVSARNLNTGRAEPSSNGKFLKKAGSKFTKMYDSNFLYGKD